MTNDKRPMTNNQEITPLELLNLYLTDGQLSGPKNSKLYQKFNHDLSWDAILNQGYQQDLAPLLYYIINKTPILEKFNSQLSIYNSQLSKSDMKYATCNSLSITRNTIEKLNALYNRNLVTNLIQFNELDKILNNFEKEGIDVIPLKGAILARSYYPDQALRPMEDIDLLVRKEDIKRTKECIKSQGYEGPIPNNDRKHFIYIKPNTLSSTIVELHIYLASKGTSFYSKISEFWENAKPINDKRKHILVLPKEFLLLHIFFHTYRHISIFSKMLKMRLIWLLDIRYIIEKHYDNLDWIFIEKKAKEWKIQSHVFSCFYLSTQLFSSSFDKKIMCTMLPYNHSIMIINFAIKMQDFNKSNLASRILMNLISLNTIFERLNTIFEEIKYLFRYNITNKFIGRKGLKKKKILLNIKPVIYFYVEMEILWNKLFF